MNIHVKFFDWHLIQLNPPKKAEYLYCHGVMRRPSKTSLDVLSLHTDYVATPATLWRIIGKLTE